LESQEFSGHDNREDPHVNRCQGQWVNQH